MLFLQLKIYLDTWLGGRNKKAEYLKAHHPHDTLLQLDLFVVWQRSTLWCLRLGKIYYTYLLFVSLFCFIIDDFQAIIIDRKAFIPLQPSLSQLIFLIFMRVSGSVWKCLVFFLVIKKAHPITLHYTIPPYHRSASLESISIWFDFFPSSCRGGILQNVYWIVWRRTVSGGDCQ